MKFSQKLRQLGIYHEGENDQGGGGDGGDPAPTGKSLEEITNQKLGGGEPEPESGDDPEPEPEPEPKDDPEPQPDPKGEEEDDPDPQPEPKGEDQPEGGAESDDGADPEEGDDPEGDFYDPEVHVEGKPAHSNKFPTREKAEYAAIHKAEMLRDKLKEMEEEGISRGAITLPKALQDDPEAVERFLSLESVHEMEDDELRSFLNESDASRQRLEAKHSREKQAKQARQTKNQYEEAQIELYDSLEKVTDADDIQANLNKFGDLEQGKQFIQSKIDAKVEAAISEDVDALEEWVDKVDEGEIELSHKEFDRQKSQKVKAIEAKERDLRAELEPTIEKFEEVHGLAEKVDKGGGEASPEQKIEQTWNSFAEMQKDLGEIPIEETGSPDLDILADTPEARAELVAAKNWLFQNRADYNDLQSPADWARGLREGWPAHKDKVRAGKQKQEIEGKKGKKGKKGESDDDIPKPGDQDKLDGINNRNVHARNESALDKLEELTNAKVGT